MPSPVEVWLWILLVMQPHNPKSRDILELCGGDASAAARMIRDGECGALSEAEKQRARRIHTSDVRRITDICQKHGIDIVTLDDKRYPLRLKAIHNPPIVLFVRGNIEGLNDEIPLAVVGTRSCCDYSVKVCSAVCTQLSKIGTVIVSGLAVGLDTAAHRACVNAGGRTIGVLACGMLENYPVESETLKRDIIASGGALISELLPYSKAFPNYFRHRNRIISGLCVGTLIVEASSRSGCLLTAEHTIEQGRDLFCIPPHDITDPRFAGVMPLLRDGAIPVFSYIDIVNEYIYGYLHSNYYSGILTGINTGMRIRSEDKPSARKKEPDENARSPKTEAEAPPKRPAEAEFSSLDPGEAAVLSILYEKPADIEAVMELSGMSHIDAAEALTDLELFGYIARNMDGTYSPIK